MPRSKLDEDIFKDSTMTFGEHLEELRVCLFRAVAGLFVGLIVGLAVGKYVVQFIQTPLTNALSKYVEEQAQERTGGNKAYEDLINQSRRRYEGAPGREPA